jgi:hypothetical protein
LVVRSQPDPEQPPALESSLYALATPIATVSESKIAWQVKACCWMASEAKRLFVVHCDAMSLVDEESVETK